MPRRWLRTFIAAAAFVITAGMAVAQTPPATPAPAARPATPAATASQGPPNALQGFSQNRGQPVQIDAQTLEVRDKEKIATFTGKVHVIQGDTDMRSQTLVVFYESDPKPDGKGTVKASQPGPGGSSDIKRLEALGDVVVTQKDQTATGDKGVFDMRSNTVTLIGNVVVSQCKNVLRGERLIVDLTTGTSRVEGGHVQGLFNRNKDEGCSKDSSAAPEPAKETRKEPAKEAPKETLKETPKETPKMRGLY
jgi:lipopolysaccharide export system protein LptA